MYTEGQFSRLSDNGIENTIGYWLDKPIYTVTQIDVPNTYFQFDVDDQFQRELSVRRDKENPEFIQLKTYLVFEPEQIPIIKSKIKNH